MQTQKRKRDLPPKLCIDLINNNDAKQAKVKYVNIMVQTLVSTHFELKD